jgi:hypothetical protein
MKKSRFAKFYFSKTENFWQIVVINTVTVHSIVQCDDFRFFYKSRSAPFHPQPTQATNYLQSSHHSSLHSLTLKPAQPKHTMTARPQQANLLQIFQAIGQFSFLYPILQQNKPLAHKIFRPRSFRKNQCPRIAASTSQRFMDAIQWRNMSSTYRWVVGYYYYNLQQ